MVAGTRATHRVNLWQFATELKHQRLRFCFFSCQRYCRPYRPAGQVMSQASINERIAFPALFTLQGLKLKK